MGDSLLGFQRWEGFDLENEFVPTIDCIRSGIRFTKAGKRMVFGVEAVLTGVPVAGLAAALALDVVEGTFGRLFGSWGAV